MSEKRRAIIQAARTVFGREGFTRTSVDAIAAEANVSKRTIYNHFTHKEHLFQTVILEGATQVAQAQAAIADRHLHKIVDLEQDLIAFARERVASLDKFSSHWALVRVIEGEVTHIRPAVLEAWMEAGQRETLRILTRWMDDLAARGLLRVDDAATAANMFNLLTFISVAQPSFYGAIPIDDPDGLVIAGVRAFLRLYQP